MNELQTSIEKILIEYSKGNFTYEVKLPLYKNSGLVFNFEADRFIGTFTIWEGFVLEALIYSIEDGSEVCNKNVDNLTEKEVLTLIFEILKSFK
ncbi:MAG: hypothetical protein MK193_14415 [Lentisphaeria bacterium]|nr:hypothetical protein [Lentisphaeria bacterium]